jgi:RIO kinase 1
VRTIPDGIVLDPVTETDLGVLRSGKEAQINIVEWTDADGTTCLVARKLYLPREVKAKGTLEALGAQRATAFRNDVGYREGRQFRKSRDRRAVERMTTYGKRLLQDRWTNHEHDVMRRLWEEGAPVPYPIRYGSDVFHLEYVGSPDRAAPQLAQSGLAGADLDRAWEQTVDGLHAVTRAGYAHGDLSAYNLLWWAGRVWFIDFPQAVDLAANPNGLDFLHRDVVNVCAWFARRGRVEDPEEVFADVLCSAFG